jgi:hypothetical protein
VSNQKRRVGIPLIGLIPPHFCIVPSQDLDFQYYVKSSQSPTLCVVVLLCSVSASERWLFKWEVIVQVRGDCSSERWLFKWEVIVRFFFYIGGIVVIDESLLIRYLLNLKKIQDAIFDLFLFSFDILNKLSSVTINM